MVLIAFSFGLVGVVCGYCCVRVFYCLLFILVVWVVCAIRLLVVLVLVCCLLIV